MSLPERRLKILDVSMQALVRVLADFERVRVIEGLHADAEAAGVYIDNDRQAIGIYVHSETYPVVSEGTAMETIRMRFRVAPEPLGLGG